MLLITRFNRLIRSRLLWTIFAVIVVVSFVGAGAMYGGCNSNQRQAGMVGKLFGKDVSNREFLLARYFELGMNEPRDLSPEGEKALRRRTWKRLAALRAAKDMELEVSNAELLDMITRDQTFSPGGVFDRERYRAIVQGQLGVNESTFEAYLRQDLILRKLMSIFQSAVWTAPYELDYRLDELTDEYALEYVVMNRDEYPATVSLDEEGIANFFEEHKELFAVPETVRVRYVAFPISNYLDTVSVSEDDVLTYYTEHADQFMEPGTNDPPAERPLEEVRDEITDRLQTQKATFDAVNSATRLVMRLAPDRYGNASTLDQAAESFSLGISTTEFFAVDEDVPGLKVDRSFNQSAFELEKHDPDRYFSDAITGSNAVYVIAAQDKRPARVPELDEVIDKVKPLAERQEAEEQFLGHCRDIRDRVAEQLDAGTAFRDAATGLGLNVNTTRTFSVYSSISEDEDVQYGEALVSGVRGLSRGDLTDILDVEAGALLGYVTERQPGDAATKVLIRPEIISSLDRYRAAAVFDEWTSYLLTAGEYDDYVVTDADEETTDEEAEGS